VDTEAKLKKKLLNIVSNSIEKSNDVRKYDYVTTDQDDDALAVTVKETDFVAISEKIAAGADAPSAKRSDDLLDAWAYIIDLAIPNKKVLAFKKVTESWNLKKKGPVYNLIFENAKLKDLEESVFRVESSVDFVSFGDVLFVLNKKNFETGLNFRAGMEKNRDNVVAEMEGLKLFHDVAPIIEKCGSNIRYLRKLSTISNNGYYKNPEFMKQLRTLNEAEGWGLKIEDNKIVVSGENVDLVLTLLNNDRLKSPINEEVFDVEVKHKVK
ncbi:MAG: Kiwa anti-phage protein KwaB-like domain-containing protein, partial [Pyrinomonadaceae bacterium]